MESNVGYICNGLNPECSGRICCFKSRGPDFGDMTCYHTTDPKYALYEGTLYPEVWVGSRFKIINNLGDSEPEVKYFEEWDTEKIKELCDTKQIFLMPNEFFRDIWIFRYCK